MYEDDVPVKQNSQSPLQHHSIHTLLSQIQYGYNNKSHLSQVIFTNTTIFSVPNSDDSAHTNSIIQTPIKPTSTQLLPFFDPFYFAIAKPLKTFAEDLTLCFQS